jgi:thiamine biosynthesis lipoprotein
MRKTHPVFTTAAVIVLLLACVYVCRRDGDSGAWREPLTYDFAVFNTICRLQVWTDESQKADDCARIVLRELQALHRTLNAFEPTSELSRLNSTAASEPFACSETLWRVMAAARIAWRQTDGWFDISFAPLLALWGKGRATLPEQAELEAVLPLVGLDKVVFDEEARTVRFTRPGMALNCGGIAKGYALDLARQLLEQAGLDCYLLDFGGNLYLSRRTPPGRQGFSVGIRHPGDANKTICRFELAGACVSTSANYSRAVTIGEKKVGHIFNAHTGQPVSTAGSVTVITPSGVASDVFSTAVFAGGTELARRLCEEVSGTGFIIVDEQGQLSICGQVPVLAEE